MRPLSDRSIYKLGATGERRRNFPKSDLLRGSLQVVVTGKSDDSRGDLISARLLACRGLGQAGINQSRRARGKGRLQGFTEARWLSLLYCVATSLMDCVLFRFSGPS